MSSHITHTVQFLHHQHLNHRKMKPGFHNGTRWGKQIWNWLRDVMSYSVSEALIYLFFFWILRAVGCCPGSQPGTQAGQVACIVKAEKLHCLKWFFGWKRGTEDQSPWESVSNFSPAAEADEQVRKGSFSKSSAFLFSLNGWINGSEKVNKHDECGNSFKSFPPL